MKLIAALLGSTSLIFIAKGNPVGQILMVVFCTLYGIISLSFKYYGEMLTYVCMSMPMAIFSFISWIRHPFLNKKSEVRVSKMTKNKIILLFVLTPVITTIFYFVLKAFNTANLVISTLSVATSFIAVYFSMNRSPYFALGYVVNDIVLIVRWTLATIQDVSYICVTVNFCVFLLNDSYSFINWKRMERKQNKILESGNFEK